MYSSPSGQINCVMFSTLDAGFARVISFAREPLLNNPQTSLAVNARSHWSPPVQRLSGEKAASGVPSVIPFRRPAALHYDNGIAAHFEIEFRPF